MIDSLFISFPIYYPRLYMNSLTLDIPFFSSNKKLKNQIEKNNAIESVFYSPGSPEHLIVLSSNIDSSALTNGYDDDTSPLFVLLKISNHYIHSTYPVEFRKGLSSICPFEMLVRESHSTQDLNLFDLLSSILNVSSDETLLNMDLNSHKGAVLSSRTIELLLKIFVTLLSKEISVSRIWKNKINEKLIVPDYLFDLVFGIPSKNLVNSELLSHLPYYKNLSSPEGRMAQATVLIQNALDRHYYELTDTKDSLPIYFRMDIFPYVVLRYCLKAKPSLSQKVRSLGLDTYMKRVEQALRNFLYEPEMSENNPNHPFLKHIRTLPLMKKILTPANKNKKTLRDTLLARYQQYLLVEDSLAFKMEFELFKSLFKKGIKSCVPREIKPLIKKSKRYEIFPERTEVQKNVKMNWSDLKPSQFPTDYIKSFYKQTSLDEWEDMRHNWELAKKVNLTFINQEKKCSYHHSFNIPFQWDHSSAFDILEKHSDLTDTLSMCYVRNFLDCGLFYFAKPKSYHHLVINHSSYTYIPFLEVNWDHFKRINDNIFPISRWVYHYHPGGIEDYSLTYLFLSYSYCKKLSIPHKICTNLQPDKSLDVASDTELLYSLLNHITSSLANDGEIPHHLKTVFDIFSFPVLMASEPEYNELISRLIQLVFYPESLETTENLLETLIETSSISSCEYLLLILHQVASLVSETDMKLDDPTNQEVDYMDFFMSEIKSYFPNITDRIPVNRHLLVSPPPKIIKNSSSYLKNLFFWMTIYGYLDHFEDLRPDLFLTKETDHLIQSTIEKITAKWNMFTREIDKSINELKTDVKNNKIDKKNFHSILDQLVPCVVLEENLNSLVLIASDYLSDYPVLEGDHLLYSDETDIEQRVEMRFKPLFKTLSHSKPLLGLLKDKIDLYSDIFYSLEILSSVEENISAQSFMLHLLNDEIHNEEDVLSFFMSKEKELTLRDGTNSKEKVLDLFRKLKEKPTIKLYLAVSRLKQLNNPMFDDIVSSFPRLQHFSFEDEDEDEEFFGLSPMTVESPGHDLKHILDMDDDSLFQFELMLQTFVEQIEDVKQYKLLSTIKKAILKKLDKNKGSLILKQLDEYLEMATYFLTKHNYVFPSKRKDDKWMINKDVKWDKNKCLEIIMYGFFIESQ